MPHPENQPSARVVRMGPSVAIDLSPAELPPEQHRHRFDADGRCGCGRVVRMDGPARTSPSDALGARVQAAEIAGRRIGNAP